MTNRYLLLVTWTLLSTCLASPDVHKQMTSEQLRSIFHVESQDLVPNYEVIHLIHHGTTEHRISKRSITSTSSSLSRSNNQFDDKNAQKKLSSHHVKKDLSKSAYYSELKRESTLPVLSKWSAPSKFLNSIISELNPSNSNSFSSDTQSKLVKISSSDNEFDIQQNENDNNNNQYKQQFKLPSESIREGENGDGDSYEQIKLDLANIKEHNVSLSVFGQLFNLTLRPTTQLFKNGTQSLPMFTVNVTPNATHGLSYEPIEEESSERVGEIFQDERNMAAILMRRQLENGDLLMEGSIGHDMVIKPVPYGLMNDENSQGRAHHIVYKRKVDTTDEYSDFAFMEPDRLQKRYRKKRSTGKTYSDDSFNRSKRAIPHIIYPEILVIVDYDGYRLHGGDNTQIKRYFVSFWNGVDLRYRLLKGPRIRISIAGIIISRGRDATPYLERNRVGRDAIDSAAALTDMGKYLFRERRLPVYDIAVAITKYDMCRRRKGGRCTKGTAGFAYVGGACVVNKRLEKVNSVAIIEDTGGFSGIIVAAHEVGHLLGAVHDGSPPPSYLGGPGAEKCRWEDGFIMSDLRHTERGFRWSPCTIQSFHHFLNGDTASCLHNAPHEDDALGRALPGTLLSLDAQCRRDRGTSACFKDERVCAQLFCFDAASGYCVAYRPAAEGSPCGDGSHCLDGRCVAEHENIIPDYSQHTPSYASPNAYQQQSLNTESYSPFAEPKDPMFTTTTTTSTLAPPIDPSSFYNFNTNQHEPFSIPSTEDPFKHFNNFFSTTTATTTTTTTVKPIVQKFQKNPYAFDFLTDKQKITTTSYPPVESFIPSTSARPTINPFYFGFNFKKPTTTTIKPFYEFPSSTYKNPYDYKEFEFNHLQTTSSTAYPPFLSHFTTHAPLPPFFPYTTSTTQSTTSEPTFTEGHTNSPESLPTSSWNPIFDIYLKRVASTTKNPYDFGNFAQYFKTTTTVATPFSFNLLSANSNAAPHNTTFQQQKR